MTEISFVMTARNDDYGGNQLHRMQSSVDSIALYAERHEVDLEVILVEWNPPPDESRLTEALSFPDASQYLTFRILTVPAEIHHSLENSEELPLFEYVAKNVGIRRSNGEFVLSTNPDNIFAEALFEYFSDPGLDPEAYYRIDRYNLDVLVDLEDTPDEWEQFALEHLESYFTANGPYWPGQYWRRPFHYLYLLKRTPSVLWDWLRGLYLNGPQSLYDLHYPAGGDFILMSRENWEQLRGHPEFEFNFHVDSYTIVQAAAMGLDEVRLPEPVRLYHQPHEDQHDVRPRGDWDRLIHRSRAMLRQEEVTLFNDHDWGLPEETFDESVAVPRRSN
jgi:hypothetical protein